jgi:hypothetical protein
MWLMRKTRKGIIKIPRDLIMLRVEVEESVGFE